MGSIQAMEMAEMLSMEDAIAWHLRSNHYPPIPVSMVQPCIDAIEAGLDEDWNRLIKLPTDGFDRNGKPFQIRWRGQDHAPAYAIIEQHHLDAWLELDEEGLEDY